MLRPILNPDLYHGHNNARNYFEGWYFKIVDPTEKYVFSFIPGVFYGDNVGSSHSFIQVLDGSGLSYNYLRYPSNYFSASKKYFSLYVRNNNFSAKGITLNLSSSNLHIVGNVLFTNIKKWPDSAINPGSMGFYNYIPKMQCYSQVSAVDMRLNGSLEVNGTTIDFTDGKGYIEKNWGSAFPYSWIWVQANNFRTKNAALSCSIGHIPFFVTSFRGFLIGLYVEDTFYKFTTINKSSINIKNIKNDVVITAENKENTLKIETNTNQKDFLKCYGPRGNKMIPLVGENLRSQVSVKLIDKSTNKTILEDISSCSGIEYGGSQIQILD